MNDLMTLCYLPSRVCVMTNCILQPLTPSLPDYTRDSVLFPAVIVQFYYTALSRRGCLKMKLQIDGVELLFT